MTSKPRGKCPKAKPRKLTVAQKAAFSSPINQPRIADRIVPHGARMGVRVYG